MALPAVMDLVADSQDEPGSGGSALFSDMSTPTRSWKQIAIHQESKQRESPPRRSSSSPATPRTSQKGVRSTSKGGRFTSPTSAEFRAAIKEKNKMEMEIGEYQKTHDEMSAAMASLHQEDYGSTIRIQELERRCEIASKQSGHLVSHHPHHMAEAWRKFEEEAQQMRKVEMNAYQYGEKKDMESNVMMRQMRQAEGTIMEQRREIAVMRSYMASEKSAAQESATHANQIHREASQQISAYQQQIRGIESSTSIEKFNEEEMVRSLKSQLKHALVKRPEMCSMEDSREQLMTRLNDVTTFAEQESSLTGGGGGPPDDPPDDADEDDDDEEDEEDEEEEEDDNRTRRGRRRLRDDREIKNERPRISRKEAERVSIPPWPKIHQLDNWKMQLLMNVLSACADPDTDTWTKWLEQALGLNPDLNLLSDSGGDRFATLDIKMAMGMQNMLRQAPDEAKDVYLDATRHSELRHQQGVIVKGRELVALAMQSFRTSDRTDLVYHIEHLFNLDFPGDKNLVVFRNKWYDLLLKMRSEDRPSMLALRDILYRKIKGSRKMEFGLNAYHRLPDKHPQSRMNSYWH